MDEPFTLLNLYSMKSVLTALALVGTLSLPAATFAATYQYVSVQGTIQSVEATNADTALVAAANIAPHSGVILVTQGGTQTTTPSGTTYQYVTTSGMITSLSATSPEAALAAAINIAPHSGVLLVMSSAVMIPTTSTVAI
jgi:hypothetical protein